MQPGDYDTGYLFNSLDYLLNQARDSLELKRKVVQSHMDNGLFPYSKQYLGTLRNHFSTIGVNGINEMIRNFTYDNHDITTEYGHQLAIDILDHIRARMIEFQDATGHMYNLEATPAEGACYRFAKEDKARWPDILQAGTPDAPYYTNSSQLPVNFTDDAFQALEMQEDLQAKYTGGTVLHLFIGNKLSMDRHYIGIQKLIKRSLERFRIPYLTISPTFSICPIHGYLPGEHEFCPLCDEEMKHE
jgi:ribonucleoside-triphosphate reductase